MSEKIRRKLVVVGSGLFGVQQMEILWESGALSETEEIVTYDDKGIGQSQFHGISVLNYPFAGHSDVAIDDNSSFLVGLGYKHLTLRREIIQKLLVRNAVLPIVRHPSAIVFSSAEIAPGVALYPGSIVDQRAKIGFGSILNNGSCISHDSTVGACSFVSGGVMVAGSCEVGAESFLGIGVLVANGIKIGSRCRIAAGAMLIKDMPDDRSGAGNPMVLLPMQIALT